MQAMEAAQDQPEELPEPIQRSVSNRAGKVAQPVDWTRSQAGTPTVKRSVVLFGDHVLPADKPLHPR